MVTDYFDKFLPVLDAKLLDAKRFASKHVDGDKFDFVNACRFGARHDTALRA